MQTLIYCLCVGYEAMIYLTCKCNTYFSFNDIVLFLFAETAVVRKEFVGSSSFSVLGARLRTRFVIIIMKLHCITEVKRKFQAVYSTGNKR